MREVGPYPHYSMSLDWDCGSDIFVVTLPELPGCRAHGRTYEEAVRQGQDAMATWLTDERHANWPVPGDFTMREQAEEDALPPAVGIEGLEVVTGTTSRTGTPLRRPRPAGAYLCVW